MSNQRRLFIRDVSLGILGFSFFVNSVFATSSSLNVNFTNFNTSIFDILRKQDVTILLDNNFSFNINPVKLFL